MVVLYDIICFVFALVYLPVYLFKGKFHQGFARRLGFLPGNLDLDRPIWIHAVSVGEAASVKGLVAELRKAYPAKKLVISTVTSTGNKIARALAADDDFLTYLPLDISFIVRKTLKKINPALFIIAETEIWPNLIKCLHEMDVPVVTVNGRISDRSYAGYRMIKFMVRPVLRMVSRFCVQSDTDALRLSKLGVEGDKIQVTGNVKFDIELHGDAKASGMRGDICLEPDDKLWVCGSTHPREEEIILSAYGKILPEFPGLKLLIAPRHPERSKDIAGMVCRNGFTPVFISGLSGLCPACVKNPVYILDIMGKLGDCYSAADVVFVGGSLVKTGGHNIIEPASWKKPVFFGPHMFNFREISRIFLENKAGVMVFGADDLAFQIKEILRSPLTSKQMSERAYDLISVNKGATGRCIEAIKGLFEA
jgi:3-deoxy-D-manno-octulosonic-acid transferase